MRSAHPKKELLRIIKKFLKDEHRGISHDLFAELCGVSRQILWDVFIMENMLLTEYIQFRVSKGYTAWKNGEVKIMMNQDRTRFVDYRKEAKPRLKRTLGLKLVNGEFKMDIGIKNSADYSNLDICEQLKRG